MELPNIKMYGVIEETTKVTAMIKCDLIMVAQPVVWESSEYH